MTCIKHWEVNCTLMVLVLLLGAQAARIPTAQLHGDGARAAMLLLPSALQASRFLRHAGGAPNKFSFVFARHLTDI
jgi:hypothetical protein